MKYLLFIFLMGCSIETITVGSDLKEGVMYPDTTQYEFDATPRNNYWHPCDKDNDTYKFMLGDASVELSIPVSCDREPYKFKGDPSPL